MNPITFNLVCDCATCPGMACTCGCAAAQPMPDTAVTCACGPACGCDAAEQGCVCPAVAA